LTISYRSIPKYAATQEVTLARVSRIQPLPNLSSIQSGAYHHEAFALMCSAVEIPVKSEFFPRRLRSISGARIRNCSGIVAPYWLGMLRATS